MSTRWYNTWLICITFSKQTWWPSWIRPLKNLIGNVRETKQLCLVFNLLIVKFKQWDQLKVFFPMRRSEIRRQKWHRWRAAIEHRSHLCIGFINGPNSSIHRHDEKRKRCVKAVTDVTFRFLLKYISHLLVCPLLLLTNYAGGLNRSLPIGLQM